MAFHEWYRVDFLCAFDTRISGKNEKKRINIWWFRKKNRNFVS